MRKQCCVYTGHCRVPASLRALPGRRGGLRSRDGHAVDAASDTGGTILPGGASSAGGLAARRAYSRAALLHTCYTAAH